MKVGYLHSAHPGNAFAQALKAFEQVGCERIVVDSSSGTERPIGLLVVASRLSAGDTLVVSTLADIADSLEGAIGLINDLVNRGVHLYSLSEGLHIEARDDAGVKALIKTLHALIVQAQQRNQALAHNGGRRAGRPRALSPGAVDEARHLVREGLAINEVAEKFKISRATLYRYLT